MHERLLILDFFPECSFLFFLSYFTSTDDCGELVELIGLNFGQIYLVLGLFQIFLVLMF